MANINVDLGKVAPAPQTDKSHGFGVDLQGGTVLTGAAAAHVPDADDGVVVVDATPDFASMGIIALRQIAGKLRVENAWKRPKAELVEILKAQTSAQ